VTGPILAAALRKLRPDRDELRRLVEREVDPAAYDRFEQLTPGPLLAAAGLVAIGVYGALAVPLRLLRRSR
jgi:hypothetical protein